MALATELTGLGMPGALAGSIGNTRGAALTGAGTTQADATLFTASVNFATTVASGAGFRLPPAAGQPVTFFNNGGANDAAVFPATGESINAIAANSAFTVTAGESAVFFPAGNRWGAILGV